MKQRIKYKQTAVLKARQFIKEAGVKSIPVNIEQYAKATNAEIKIRHDLNDDESGHIFPLKEKNTPKEKNIIVVNGNHLEVRRRFTILHEIAHIILDLPSKHHGTGISHSDFVGYHGRPREEIMCDAFAVECLMPFDSFKKNIDDIGANVSFDVVKELAERYKASITSTGSHFALHCNIPCTFVLMERNEILNVSKSESLRELGGWIDYGTPIPKGSVAQRLSVKDGEIQDCDEIPTDIWFSKEIKGYNVLTEEAMLIKERNQCLSLIWFDDSQATNQCGDQYADDDESSLIELDGVLPWPEKKRRR